MDVDPNQMPGKGRGGSIAHNGGGNAYDEDDDAGHGHGPQGVQCQTQQPMRNNVTRDFSRRPKLRRHPIQRRIREKYNINGTLEASGKRKSNGTLSRRNVYIVQCSLF